jgi:hypothetical protein
MDAGTLEAMRNAPGTAEQWAREACDDDYFRDECYRCGEVVDLAEVEDNGGTCPFCGEPFSSALA